VATTHKNPGVDGRKDKTSDPKEPVEEPFSMGMTCPKGIPMGSPRGKLTYLRSIAFPSTVLILSLN
jgi:hypothetical protein